MYLLAHRLAAIIVVVALPVIGCSSDATQGTVDGKITLDGQSVKSGVIRFVPADGLSPTADTTFTEGTFSAKVPVGEKRVEITAPKVVGTKKMIQTPDSPTVEIVKELLPERYNVRSELTITVVAGRQQKDFALESGK
jgi:hypothetical protein